MLKWLGIIVGVIVVLVAAVFIAGSMMPQNHTASRTAQLSQPPESVWTVITNIDSFPSWRNDVAVAEQLPSRDGKVVWRETSRSRNALTYEAETAEPPRHLVTRITDKGLPFGGSWDYMIVPDGSGSRITITEHGEIYNPIFRVVSRAMGHTSTIDAYLKSLAGRLGDSYTPPG
ncbi:MAG TPA: SRPBCC family protein [Gemmatimonadaceae bacterium]|nr:SRPBCC family protein [Gemmatimonadaceae bacterium]